MRETALEGYGLGCGRRGLIEGGGSGEGPQVMVGSSKGKDRGQKACAGEGRRERRVARLECERRATVVRAKLWGVLRQEACLHGKKLHTTICRSMARAVVKERAKGGRRKGS